MRQFYSSLVINYRKYPNVHQVFKPQYNKEYFKRVTAKTQQLETVIRKRCNIDTYTDYPLTRLKDDSKKLLALQEDLQAKSSEDDLLKIRNQIAELEEKIMPLVVNLPNQISGHVPSEDTVIEQLEFKTDQDLFKVLDYRKLSYINNCYSKSVVGPNSHYYFGIGAKLQQGLVDFFASELENGGFIQASGLSLVKTAIVEATNTRDNKDFACDPCRIITGTNQPTTLHLVEASRESLAAFVSTLDTKGNNDPLRLMSTGAGYRNGSEWFDSDEKKMSQFETLHALTLCPSILQYSMKEYHSFRDNLWSIYKQLNLPVRLVHCSIDSMKANEYDAYRIEVWMPSQREWMEVSRMSHYLNYITVRMGMKRGHIVDSSIFDGQTLQAAIIENKQTSRGRFIIPTVIKPHMPYLDEMESQEYFRDQTIEPAASSSMLNHEQRRNLSTGVNNNVLLYHEQRRYLVKKFYRFGHSKQAERNARPTKRLKLYMTCTFIGMVLVQVDWEEVWIDFVPKPAKRVLYDYVYRPYRWLRVWILYSSQAEKPKDIPFDEENLERHELTRGQRKKLDFFRPPVPE